MYSSSALSISSAIFFSVFVSYSYSLSDKNITKSSYNASEILNTPGASIESFCKTNSVAKSNMSCLETKLPTIFAYASCSITMSGSTPPPSYTVRPFLVLNAVLRESATFPTLPSSFLLA